MPSDDLTVRILIEIRDRIDQTNTRLDLTNVRLDNLSDRVEHLGDRVDHHIEQTAARFDHLEAVLSRELVGIHTTMKQVVDVMKGRRRLE